MSSSPPQLEDVPELMQLIQLRLPVRKAARTSVLSKSWLHAWTTIPTLRFRIGTTKDMKLVDMERTLARYQDDNIPIEKFDLRIDIDDQESVSLVEKHIQTIATKTCNTLKELSLSFFFQLYGASFNFPDEIFSCENITKISVSSTLAPQFRQFISCRLSMSNPVTINCVSLRELFLDYVDISQELLDGILSSCRLLVEVHLSGCSRSLDSINIKNLPCLEELAIVTDDGGSTAVDINNVPNLRLFNCILRVRGENPIVPFNAHSISLGSSLKELSLIDVVTDNASLDMITSGAIFLESLTLCMTSWNSESFHFTSATIKRLSLLWCPSMLIDVQVYAPNLLFFRYEGDTMPSLLFPISTLIKKTRFRLMTLRLPIDASFFLKMREALALSRNCYVHISLSHGTLGYPAPPPWDIDIDDLRTRLPDPPAMKVQQLSFETWWNDECKWEHSPFFDAFFEICHPNHVTAMENLGCATKGGNYLCKLLLREVLVNKNRNKKKTTMSLWPRCLKHVQIKNHKKWEALTSSHQSFLNGPSPAAVYFKLQWR